MIIIGPDDRRELFRVEFTEHGYFAVRDANPRFALQGSSIADVSAKAERALDFIRRIRQP